MPVLREAVENKRQFYISFLENFGIYKDTINMQNMTFTELKNMYEFQIKNLPKTHTVVEK